jgi:hypothetical protein
MSKLGWTLLWLATTDLLLSAPKLLNIFLKSVEVFLALSGIVFESVD